MYVVRPFAQEIEHLQKRQSYNKIVGGVGLNIVAHVPFGRKKAHGIHITVPCAFTLFY